MIMADRAKGLAHSITFFEEEIKLKRTILDCFEKIIGAVKKGDYAVTTTIFMSYFGEVVVELKEYGYEVEVLTPDPDNKVECKICISWERGA